MTRRLWGTVLLAGGLLASCSGSAPEAARRPAAVAAGSEEAWEGRPLEGVGDGTWLWDVAVNDAGVFVATGTVAAEEYSGEYPLVIWRSEDGITWREVFRRQDLLETGDGSGLAPPNTVVAHGGGFALVGGDCPESCHPVALYSKDGSTWHEAEVPVRLPPPAEPAAATGGGGGLSGRRVIRGSPEYTLAGAAMIDVTAVGDRLVAVGWAQDSEKWTTSHAAWISDDGGRSWSQAPDGAFGGHRQTGGWRDELNRIVAAGDRVVAGGGNRCCHDQSVSEVWVSEDGHAWRAVTLPDGQSLSIFGMAVRQAAVHVTGRAGFGQGEGLVHWQLSGDDTWERLPAPPRARSLVGDPSGLALIQNDWTDTGAPGRINLFRSPDGHDFRLSETTAPVAGLNVDTALVVGDRLLVYARSDDAYLLFESRAGDD